VSKEDQDKKESSCRHLSNGGSQPQPDSRIKSEREGSKISSKDRLGRDTFEERSRLRRCYAQRPTAGKKVWIKIHNEHWNS